MNNTPKNKQHKYAIYAIENGLKRLKLYHKGQKQLQNFYKYCDMHKDHLEKVKVLESIDVSDIESRLIIDEFIYDSIYVIPICDYPNLYHFEMEKLKKDILNKAYIIFHSFMPITIEVESDFEPYSGIREFKTPRSMWRDYSNNDIWCYGYCLYNGIKYNLGEIKDCQQLFREYKFN